MKIIQTHEFEKAAKKLHIKQKKKLDEAVRAIMADPDIGEPKKADLSGVSVYKFKIHTQLILLAYSYDPAGDVLTLLAFGPHENFYRDLAK